MFHVMGYINRMNDSLLKTSVLKHKNIVHFFTVDEILVALGVGVRGRELFNNTA
jgi:hypothetical protein